MRTTGTGTGGDVCGQLVRGDWAGTIGYECSGFGLRGSGADEMESGDNERCCVGGRQSCSSFTPFGWIGELVEDQLVVGEEMGGNSAVTKAISPPDRAAGLPVGASARGKYSFETRYVMIFVQDYLHLPFKQIVTAIEQLA